jgi:hypothetical protein
MISKESQNSFRHEIISSLLCIEGIIKGKIIHSVDKDSKYHSVLCEAYKELCTQCARIENAVEAIAPKEPTNLWSRIKIILIDMIRLLELRKRKWKIL